MYEATLMGIAELARIKFGEMYKEYLNSSLYYTNT